MAHLFVVRHAKAGERRLWTDDDLNRPLSKKGRKQSELIGNRLAKLEPTQLVSSPYIRCIQTLQPLAEMIGTEVSVDQRLGENEPFEPVIELLRELPIRSVLSTHGDIIPATMQALIRRGMKLSSQPDWRKSAIWVLKRNKQGDIVHARVWPPPVI